MGADARMVDAAAALAPPKSQSPDADSAPRLDENSSLDEAIALLRRRVNFANKPSGLKKSSSESAIVAPPKAVQTIREEPQSPEAISKEFSHASVSSPLSPSSRSPSLGHPQRNQPVTPLVAAAGLALSRPGSASTGNLLSPSSSDTGSPLPKRVIRRRVTMGTQRQPKLSLGAVHSPARRHKTLTPVAMSELPALRGASKSQAVRSASKSQAIRSASKIQGPSSGPSSPSEAAVERKLSTASLGGGSKESTSRGDGSPVHGVKATMRTPQPKKSENYMYTYKLSQQAKIPREEFKKAAEIFMRHAGCDMPEEAAVPVSQFSAVLCDLCGVDSPSELPERFFEQAMQSAARCQDIMDLREFSIWFSAFSFCEELNLDSAQKEHRKLGRKLDIAPVELDKYHRSFRSFDLDGSGCIDKEEFNDLLKKLLKIPQGMDMPAQRVQDLWRQADVDGSGEIDFEEFVIFYRQTFDTSGESETSPFEDYYRDIRRV